MRNQCRRRARQVLVYIALAGPAALPLHAQRTPAARAEALQIALERDVAAGPSVHGQLLYVHAPAAGLDTTLVAGSFDRRSGRRLAAHDGFRVASVTKTFVAAATLRLVEHSELTLDDPIAHHLPALYDSLLRADGYDTHRMTLRHLLSHTSGISDYATDERYVGIVTSRPQHRWTPEEQVRAAMEWGEPHFAPGAGYHYSDTGYVLLGVILQRRTRLPLPQAVRTLLDYDRLGLDETYFEALEAAPPRAGDLSHAYLGDVDVSVWDPSFDLYGGGGIVSSAEDLARFYRALLRGQVFREVSTLRTMLSVPLTNAHSAGGAYALGIQRMMIGGIECWGHTGFWGTSAHHCPESDVTIVRHTNQAIYDDSFVFDRLYGAIVEALGR